MAATGSSTTSSPTSLSSSTSDPGPSAAARLLGWARLTHPFPSILDGVVSGAVAVLAGGAPDAAIRIGLAMTLLQLGIGTTNDLVDAPRDAGRKAGKPIPAGLVPRTGALALALACFGGGVALAGSVSAATALLALVVIAIGLAYDLRLKGTAWSWLPFAVGIPFLPVFGWVGATGGLHPVFAVLVPAAVVAGAGLAIGNALVDVERDRAAGISSVALALGEGAAGAAGVALLGVVWVLAVASAWWAGAGLATVGLIAGVGLVPPAAAVLARPAQSARRERLWQAEAVGLAVLAAIWLATVLGAATRSGA
jgi:4-hydroxybenzoate polyprenyltransferase